MVPPDTSHAATWTPGLLASMGTVCDLDGRVQGQRGLYVLDGALIPGGSAACNPSITIAAIAELALDNMSPAMSARSSEIPITVHTVRETAQRPGDHANVRAPGLTFMALHHDVAKLSALRISR